MTDRQAQNLLQYLGYYQGTVDGIRGQQTEQATRDFQADFGLDPDGIRGKQTEKALRHAVCYGMPVTETAADNSTWWDGIRYWTREEFRCRCGEYHTPYCNGFPVEPDRTLVELVDDIRHELGVPCIRSSGIRCEQHNADQPGSVSNSRHLGGKALDFKAVGKTAQQVLAVAQMDKRCRYAYIIGNGPYVHVDVE